MQCMICEARTSPYLTKQFDLHGLGTVHYDRCVDCGFVFSRTHFEMTTEEWERLNATYHHGYQNSTVNQDDPNWVERLLAQARAIAQLTRIGFLSQQARWVDYACGDGKLGRILGDVGLDTACFDRYMGQAGYLTEAELLADEHDLVLNTSYLEHIRSIRQIEEMLELLADDGVFAFHTAVNRVVPRDPHWFYFLPVHCAFYSDESMRRLFQRHGFKYCVFHRESTLWFWARTDRVRQAFDRVRRLELGPSFYAATDFVNPSRRERLARQMSWQVERTTRFARRTLVKNR